MAKIFNKRIYKDQDGCWWCEINYSNHFKLGRTADRIKEACGHHIDGLWTLEEIERYVTSDQFDDDQFVSDWNAWCG